ncbi:DnaJ-class molecular chaperone [Spinactinospora alkalitolerans]|uniref:DnaJ-class molecular chaperone n=1 Tax=Spinactinospora alkalitolerans TaxID=687207 RepID=A0A852TWM3_9ACTN|nr:DnaJ-class molecular chaperone [Spinactinospora alkalitolerans]
MGDHRKEVNCNGCRGTGRVQQSDDGRMVMVPCTLCGGSGKQP